MMPLLLPAADRRVQAWRNGGGTTQDVALSPGELVLADAGGERTLRPGDPACAFAGDVSMAGRPTGRVVRDLNLMVRRGSVSGRLRHVAAGPGRAAGGIAALVAPEGAEVRVNRADFACDRAIIVAEIDGPHDAG